MSEGLWKQSPSNRVPVTIITGFLGSGKTTFLNRLLRHERLRHTAIIVNEFGEIGLDHLFIEAADETVLLDNGCICCTILGDLALTLATLIVKKADGSIPHFERVVVETTGLADPTPILQSVVTDPTLHPHYRPGSVVTLVDCTHASSQLDRHVQATRQAALADLLVLSKTDLAIAGEIAIIRDRLRAINPAAAITTAGDVDLLVEQMIRDDDAAQSHKLPAWLQAASSSLATVGQAGKPSPHSSAQDPCDHAHDDQCGTGVYPQDDHGASHAGGVCTFSVTRSWPMNRRTLAVWLHNLAAFFGQRILRMKGIVNVEGRPVAVHIVQSLVHDPQELATWPDASTSTRLVFITLGLARNDLDHLIQSMDYEVPSATQSIDPDEFRRFVSLMRPFRLGSVSE